VRAAALGLTAFILSASAVHAQATWRLGERPVFSIGAVDGDAKYTLSEVRGGLRLADGRVVIVNGNALRWYDAQGRHLLTAGGSGGGPGEFGYLAQVLPGRGDTILAWDMRMRLSRFDANGRFITSTTYDRTQTSLDGMFSEGSTLLPDGSLLLPLYRGEKPGDPKPSGLFRPEIRYARLDPAVGKPAMIGTTVYGGLRQQYFDAGGRPSSSVQPFTPHAQVAANGGRIYVTNGDEFVIDAYDYTGTRVLQFRSSRRPVAVTRAQLEDYRDRMIAMMRERNQPQRIPEFERAWSAIEPPKTHPAITALHTDRLGNVWARVNLTMDGSPMTQYLVFDAAGREAALVRVPARFTPLDIGADYVLGQYTDELDVPYVQLYTLTRR